MEVRPIDGNILRKWCEKIIDQACHPATVQIGEVFLDKVRSMPTLTLPNEWVSAENAMPAEHKSVLCIVSGKPRPRTSHWRRRISLDRGIRLTAGSSMNIWTGKMLLSCGGCPFRSRRERRGEDGRERGNHSTYRTEEIL